MGAVTTISLANGSAAAVSFTPEQCTPALSSFVDRTTGIATQFKRLSVRYSPATNQRQSVKTAYSVSLPISGTLPSGATGIVRTLRAEVSYQLPDGCLDAERLDLHAFIVNGLSNALIRGSLRDNDPIY